MADEDSGSNVIDDTSNLSEAEKRRLRRRQKILENQGARLQKILSNESGVSHKEVAETASLNSTGATISTSAGYADQEVSKKTSSPARTPTRENTDRRINQEAADKVEATSAHHNHNSASTISSSSNRREPDNLPSLLRDVSVEDISQSPKSTEQSRNEVRLGVQADGTVYLPKISNRVGRILLCLLALFLSFFNAKQYAITFMSWEIAFYFLNGLPPMPPPNMVMVLAAVMGLRESHLSMMKKTIHIVNCAILDFSLFIMFVMMPHFVSHLIKTLQ